MTKLKLYVLGTSSRLNMHWMTKHKIGKSLRQNRIGFVNLHYFKGYQGEKQFHRWSVKLRVLLHRQNKVNAKNYYPSTNSCYFTKWGMVLNHCAMFIWGNLWCYCNCLVSILLKVRFYQFLCGVDLTRLYL